MSKECNIKIEFECTIEIEEKETQSGANKGKPSFHLDEIVKIIGQAIEEHSKGKAEK